MQARLPALTKRMAQLLGSALEVDPSSKVESIHLHAAEEGKWATDPIVSLEAAKFKSFGSREACNCKIHDYHLS